MIWLRNKACLYSYSKHYFFIIEKLKYLQQVVCQQNPGPCLDFIFAKDYVRPLENTWSADLKNGATLWITWNHNWSLLVPGIVQVPFAAPLKASQTTDFTAFAKFFFCPKLSMGLVWDLFFRHYKSRPKVDLYDTSFCELASPLLLLAVILFFFPQLKGRASATASIAAACAVWKVWQYRFKVVNVPKGHTIFCC